MSLLRAGPGRGRRAPRRPRVCIIRQSDVYELSLRREAEALVDAGYDVDVICMHHPDRPKVARIDGVTVLSVAASRVKGGKLRYLSDYLVFLVLAAIRVSTRHMRRPYDVVQVNTMPDVLVLAGLMPKLLGARVFAFMKEPAPELGETVLGPGPMIGVLRHAEKLALGLADHTFTVTEELKQRYVRTGAHADDVTVVLNCPSPANLLPERVDRRVGIHEQDALGHPSFTLVCHGSIEDRYGYDTILHAVDMVRSEIPGIAFVATGRGSGVGQMLGLVEDLRLGDIVSYEGWVSQKRLAEILRTADVGIVAQKASPYSHLVHTNKMVDYWVFGLPVIASRLRATSATFDDSVVEYFEPGSADDLAAKILHLYNDPDRYAELVTNGRRAEAEYGWAAQRRAYLAVYESLCPRRSLRTDGTRLSPTT